MEFSKDYLKDCLVIDNIQFEKDFFNHDYEGLRFVVNDMYYHSRLAKKTPTKNGYFLAMWEKNKCGVNIPYDVDSNFDFLLVIVKDGKQQGHFSFPKSTLIEKGILSNQGMKGKMAFRVYTPWNVNLNANATKTQTWQTNYFVDTSIK